MTSLSREVFLLYKALSLSLMMLRSFPRVLFLAVFVALLVSCESGGWVESYESEGSFPDLERNHLYQLVVWERYYSYKPFGSCSSGGRDFKEVYYLIDYDLSGREIGYNIRMLAELKRKRDIGKIVDSICRNEPAFQQFYRIFKQASERTSGHRTNTAKRLSDSLMKKQIYFVGVCGDALVFHNDDVVGKTNDTLYFYAAAGERFVCRKLTIDSKFRLFTIVADSVRPLLILRDRDADSLVLYAPVLSERKISLGAPLNSLDLSVVPDSVKMDEYGDLNRSYTLSVHQGSSQLLWLNQRRLSPSDTHWMLYGFDEIWYLRDGRLNYYQIPYDELTGKLAKLR